MGIKNLTEAEEKEFYRLVEKMNGKEPDKKQDAKVKKPQYGDTVYYINYIGRIRKRTTYVVKEKEHGRYQTNRLHDRLPRDGKRRNQLQKKMGNENKNERG